MGAPPPMISASAIAVVAGHRCAIEASGAVVCWGDDSLGQASPPSSVDGTTGTASEIAAGVYHNCAIQAGTGAVRCWGHNRAGEAAQGRKLAESKGFSPCGQGRDGNAKAPASIRGTRGGVPMNWIALPVLIALALAVGACREEGGAERMGREIDEAVEETREAGEEAVDEIGEELDEAAEEVEEAAEEAREKARKATN
jgi:hypothetical protein